MDIAKILKHSIELLQVRGEDTTSFESEINEISTERFCNDLIKISTSNITVFYAFSKEKLKELWNTIRLLDEDEMEKMYGCVKFIIILHEYPSSFTQQALQSKHQTMLSRGGFIQLFQMKELMYNPMNHVLVPKHKKLSEEDAKKVLEELHIKSRSQLPLIQRNDIISRWLGLQQWDIVKITRYNDTSGKYYYYRCCI